MNSRGGIVVSDRPEASDFTEYGVAHTAKVFMCFEELDELIDRNAFAQVKLALLTDCHAWLFRLHLESVKLPWRHVQIKPHGLQVIPVALVLSFAKQIA